MYFNTFSAPPLDILVKRGSALTGIASVSLE
jgi:hypothetical protein